MKMSQRKLELLEQERDATLAIMRYCSECANSGYKRRYPDIQSARKIGASIENCPVKKCEFYRYRLWDTKANKALLDKILRAVC